MASMAQWVGAGCVVGTVLGGIVGAVLAGWPVAEAPPEEIVYVAVAARDLNHGVTVQEEDLYGVAMPRSLVPAGALGIDEALLRIPHETVLAGEFVREERLADPWNRVGLAAIIPRGMRVLSLNLARSGALAEAVQPGAYVDLLVTRPGDPADPQSAPVTKIEEQSVFLLGSRRLNVPKPNVATTLVETPQSRELAAMARQIAALEARLAAQEGQKVPEPADLNLLLLVTREQAERIVASTHGGEVTVTVRNDLDSRYVTTQGVDATTLPKVVSRHDGTRLRLIQGPPKEVPIPVIGQDGESTP